VVVYLGYLRFVTSKKPSGKSFRASGWYREYKRPSMGKRVFEELCRRIESSGARKEYEFLAEDRGLRIYDLGNETHVIGFFELRPLEELEKKEAYKQLPRLLSSKELVRLIKKST